MWLDGFEFLHWIHRCEYFVRYGLSLCSQPSPWSSVLVMHLADEEILPSPTPFLSQMEAFLTIQPYSFKVTLTFRHHASYI